MQIPHTPFSTSALVFLNILEYKLIHEQGGFNDKNNKKNISSTY